MKKERNIGIYERKPGAGSLEFPLIIEECFHKYGGIGPWIFLYFSSPSGGEECGGLGPWIFLYLSSPPVAAKNVSTNMVGSVPGYSSIYPFPVATKNVSTKM
jgi:hypothetical protein